MLLAAGIMSNHVIAKTSRSMLANPSMRGAARIWQTSGDGAAAEERPATPTTAAEQTHSLLANRKDLSIWGLLGLAYASIGELQCPGLAVVAPHAQGTMSRPAWMDQRCQLLSCAHGVTQ